MIDWDEIEPSYNETVSIEVKESLEKEIEELEQKYFDKADDLDCLVETIVEYGNKYPLDEAYAKVIEYMHEVKLV